MDVKDLTIRPSFHERTLRDFYYVIFRHKWKIMIFFFTVMICTTLATFLAPKIYESEAKLMVRLGRESVTLDPTATTGQLVNISPTRDNEIKTELDILQSRTLAEQVVDFIGYKKFLKPSKFLFLPSFALGSESEQDVQQRQRDQVIRTLMKNMEIETQNNSNIISIGYETEDPNFGQLVVNKLISFYLDKHINAHRTAGSDEFFAQQTQLLRAKLTQAQEDLRDLKNESGIAAVGEQRTILLNRIGSLQKYQEETEATLSASAAKVKSMENTLSDLPKTLLRLKVTGYSGNPVDYLQQKLHDLQLKEQDLLSKFNEKNNLVQEVHRQIQEVQALLEKEAATKDQTSQLVLINEKANLSELQGKKQALKNELMAALGELKGFNDHEIKIADLQRNVDLLNANYRNYSDKLEQARIDKALNLEKISNISIVQAATLPVKPIRPRKTLNLALGTLLGLFGGLGLAFFLESIDHSFKTPDDVTRKLQLPVLETIPKIKSISGYQQEDIPLLFPDSPAGWDLAFEMTNRCQLTPHNLLCLDHSNELSTVLAITSCYSGEGVSTFAASLAENLVRQGGGRVLLVDTNISKPSVHKLFVMSKSPGFADIFKNPESSNGIRPSSIKNLDIMPSGEVSVNFGRLFDPRKIPDLISHWKSEYSSVIFDTPAINENNLCIHLSRLVDGTVLVIEAERTRWEAAQRAIDILDTAKANVVGVVLNKRQFAIPDWLYRTL